MIVIKPYIKAAIKYHFEYVDYILNPIVCKCGCGTHIPFKICWRYTNIPVYIRGHREKVIVLRDNLKMRESKLIRVLFRYYNYIVKPSVCICGCGRNLPYSYTCIYDSAPKYIFGHNPRLKHSHSSWNKGMKFPFKKRQPHSEETKRKQSERRKGYVHIHETKEKIAKSHSGDKSHFWKGGISFKPYCPKFNKRKKEEIRNNYNRKCYACGKEENDNILSNGVNCKLPIHHIDMDKGQGCNGKQWKLVPLCNSCHAKVHNGKIGFIF